MSKTYLGDGVYADVVHGLIRLTTENGVSVTNTIYLEAEVFGELVAFQKRVSWVPPMEVAAGAAAVMAQLTLEDIAYAGDPERGEYRGFAALHDRCDANMLLPGAEDCSGGDAQIDWLNLVMESVSLRIIGDWEGIHAAAKGGAK